MPRTSRQMPANAIYCKKCRKGTPASFKGMYVVQMVFPGSYQEPRKFGVKASRKRFPGTVSRKGCPRKISMWAMAHAMGNHQRGILGSYRALFGILYKIMANLH